MVLTIIDYTIPVVHSKIIWDLIFMSDHNLANVIDLVLDLDLKEIVLRIYKQDKNLYISLNDLKNIITATNKSEYTTFRKEIGKLLKEKKVHDEYSKRILNLIEDNGKLLYTEKDDNSIANDPIKIVLISITKWFCEINKKYLQANYKSDRTVQNTIKVGVKTEFGKI
jgi:hypothetical protein